MISIEEAPEFIDHLRENIRRLNARISSLEDCLKARDERIENLKETVERLDTENTRLKESARRASQHELDVYRDSYGGGER